MNSGPARQRRPWPLRPTHGQPARGSNRRALPCMMA
jgi:hypothetical protein